MSRFWLQGVVKNGQVVLSNPLDLPDGTVVTVMDYDADDNPEPVGPQLILTDEEYAEFEEYFTGKKDRNGIHGFLERVEKARAGRTEVERRAS